MKLTDLLNEEKYTLIDPKGNPAGTGTKMQVNQRQKKLGGSKKGYFVVPAKQALKARRTLEKYKFDFKNPKLQDLMSDLYFEGMGESVNEGRAFVQAARKAREEGKTEFEFNGKTYPVTLKETQMKLTDLINEGKFRKEERDLKNLAGVIKIDLSEALEMLEEDGVLEAIDHLEIAVERLQDMIKDLKRKK